VVQAEEAGESGCRCTSDSGERVAAATNVKAEEAAAKAGRGHGCTAVLMFFLHQCLLVMAPMILQLAQQAD